jgi:WD40 repeat protein
MVERSGISDEEIAHLEELIGVWRRRLRLLDMQLAKNAGNPSASAQILLEREESERQLTSALAELRRLRPSPLADRSPYLGLLTFQESHADLFFGRDALIADLLERVRRAPFLGVLGASGSGKSSVVRAGLLPMLKSGGLPGSETWRYITFKPGARPLDALAVELAKLQGGDLSQALNLSMQLAESDRALLFAIELLLDRAAGQRLVLVIDQFEEVWTQMPLEEEARSAFVKQQQLPFIQRLLTALTMPDTPLMVILTMRIDFLHRVTDEPALANAISEHNVIVSPMTAAELREMIVRPVELAGGDFEPGLVDELVEHGQRGALPLLEYTLAELWKEREANGMMTWEAYRALGGVEGALAARADALLGEHYNPEQQYELRQVLLRLVQPGEGVADTRRRVRLDQLVLAGKSFEELYSLLRPLIDERLLTSGRDDTNGEETVEVSHEELIRAWPTLGRWINEARADLRFQLRLEEAAQDWEAGNKHEGLLWSGLRLSNTEAWLERAQPRLNARDLAFIEACRAAERARADAEEAARLRDLERAHALAEEQRLRAEEQQRLAEIEHQRAEEQAVASKHLRRRAILLTASLVIALFAALGAAWFAFAAQDASEKAEQVATIALARQLAAQAIQYGVIQPDRAILLALQANYIHDEAQTRSALLTVLTANERLIGFINDHTSAVNHLVFSHNGKILISASTDMVQLRDITEQHVIGKLPLPPDTRVSEVAISPDGVTLAISASNGLSIWNAQTLEPLGTLLEGDHGSYISMSFSSDGKFFAFSNANMIYIWDMASKQLIDSVLRDSEGFIIGIDLSSDGKTLSYVTTDAYFYRWDILAKQLLEDPIRLHNERINVVAFSPDDELIAFCNDESLAIRLWDIEHQELLLGEFKNQTEAIIDLKFSPDSNLLASTAENQTVRLWDTSRRQTFGEQLRGHIDTVSAIAFSPDNMMLASASSDNSIRLWDISNRELQGHEDYVTGVAFSPDGTIAASVSGDGIMRLWDVANRQPLGEPLQLSPDYVWVLTFSPDGSKLAFSSNKIIQLWDVASQQAIGQPFKGHEDIIYDLEFSPDGKMIASASRDTTVRLWDVATYTQLGEPMRGHTKRVNAIAFNPNGTILASAGDNYIQLWDVASHQALGEPLRGHTDVVNHVAFSPDGNILASAGDDTTIRLWKIPDRTPMGEPLQGHTRAIHRIAFSPDSLNLVSAGDEKTIRFWDVANRTLLGEALRDHHDEVTDIAFSPDGTTLMSASGNFVYLWDVRLRAWDIQACRTAGRNLSLDEWQQFVGEDRPYERTCQNYPPGVGAPADAR